MVGFWGLLLPISGNLTPERFTLAQPAQTDNQTKTMGTALDNNRRLFMGARLARFISMDGPDAGLISRRVIHDPGGTNCVRAGKSPFLAELARGFKLRKIFL
jgi:hypothetical protein